MAIGSLAVRVTSDTASFNQGMKKAGRGANSLKGDMESVTRVSGKMKGAILAVVSALTVGLIAKSAQSAKELKNLAALSDTSAAQFKKLALGARDYGVEQDKLADILKDTKDRVGDFLATGGGPMADFFENIAPKVGVTAEQFRKLSGPQALQLYVDSLEKANLSQSELTFYMEAMASDATALLPLLRNGGEEMAKQAKEAEELGLVLSDIDTERLAQMQKDIEEGTDMFKSLTGHLSADLAPVLSAVIDQFGEAAKEAGGFGKISERVSWAAAKGFGFLLDVLNFLRISAKTITLAFQSLGTALNSVALMVVEGWQRLFDMIVGGIENVIASANNIPGVDIPTEGLANFRKEVRRSADEHRNFRDVMAKSVAQTAKELHEMAMQPIPSEKLDKFLEEAKEKSRIAAEEVIAQRERMRAETDGEESGGQPGENKKIQERLDQLRNSFMTERSMLEEKLALDKELLNQALAEEQITKQDHYHLLQNLKARHEAALTESEQKAAAARKAVAEQEAKAKKAIMAGALGSLTTLMNSESRKMFEVGKAAAIGQSIISTYTGMTKALELGWPLGPIAAGAIGAAGFANVQSIRSQSFGSGGGGAGSVTQQVSGKTEPVSGGQQQQERGGTYRVEGVTAKSLLTGETMMSMLSDMEEDGAFRGQLVFG